MADKKTTKEASRTRVKAVKVGVEPKKGTSNPLSQCDEYSIVVVKWQDACYQYAECTADLLSGYMELVTAGHLVALTDDIISIGMDYAPSDRTWRHVTHIPKQMVLEIVKLGGLDVRNAE